MAAARVHGEAGLRRAMSAAQASAWEMDGMYESPRLAATSAQPGIFDAPRLGVLSEEWFEGPGRLLFLPRFGSGGCLADAMGLGKTARTPALPETRWGRRQTGDLPSPLVVASRSLVFIWRQEAGKFMPRIRVLEYTGVGRSRSIF